MNAHSLPGRAVLAVLVTVVGALLTGQMAVAADSDGKALVYVMQANAGGYANLIVYIDGKPIGQIREKTHLIVQMLPGSHEISSAGSARGAISIKIEAGRYYYVRQSVSASGVPEFSLLNETEGQALLAQSEPMGDRVLTASGMATPISEAAVSPIEVSQDRRDGAGPAYRAKRRRQSSGMYIGLGVSQVKAKGASATVADNVASEQAFVDFMYGPGVVAVSGTAEDTGQGMKFFVGYRFNSFLALEGGYTDFGELKATVTEIGGPTNSIETDTLKTNGINIALSGLLPIGDHFIVSGKFGILGWISQYDTTTVYTSPSFTDSTSDKKIGFSPFLGVGAQVNVTKQFGLRVEFLHYLEVGDDPVTAKFDFDEISLSTIYSF